MCNKVCLRGLAWCLGAVVTLATLVTAAGPLPQPEIPIEELRPHFATRSTSGSYTYSMLELGMRMGAASADALRGNKEPATASLAGFRAQYEKVAAMVPSWRAQFPMDPLDELEKAVQQELSSSVKEAIIVRIENTCTRCHVRHMFPTQAYFKWGRFADIEVTDDNDEDVGLHQIMLDLANGLGAIRNDVANSEFKEARKVYALLRDRFTMMELACDACHAEPREYFIDSRVKGRLLRLGGLLRKGSDDIDQYNRLLNQIYELSCFPCHQVHMPPAYMQEYWRSSGK